MDAMSYEIMIRRVYHCGRYGSKGADADIYRKMEHAKNLLTAKNWGETQTLREDKYHKAAYEVATFVSLAITKSLREITIPEKVTTLEKLRSKLAMQTDKKIIDEVIEEALNIFVELDLEIR